MFKKYFEKRWKEKFMARCAYAYWLYTMGADLEYISSNKHVRACGCDNAMDMIRFYEEYICRKYYGE